MNILEHLKTLVLPSIWRFLIIIRGHGAALEVRRGLGRGSGGEGGASSHAPWPAPSLDGRQVRVGEGVGAQTSQAVALGLH